MVFLLGNGYAPVITVRDSTGQVVYSDPTPFLPQDGNYTSTGVVKAPGAQPKQLGLIGQFLPTGTRRSTACPARSSRTRSTRPCSSPSWRATSGWSAGTAQSVYTLDVAG